MTDIARFIAEMPKAELHLHIEGTLEPEMMMALAERNGITLPYASIAEVKAAYDFSCLQDFLDLYYQGMSVLLTAAGFLRPDLGLSLNACTPRTSLMWRSSSTLRATPDGASPSKPFSTASPVRSTSAETRVRHHSQADHVLPAATSA